MNTEQQCAFCGYFFPAPVGHYHSEEECEQNQREGEFGEDSKQDEDQ